jgi:hypothetical protein
VCAYVCVCVCVCVCMCVCACVCACVHVLTGQQPTDPTVEYIVARDPGPWAAAGARCSRHPAAGNDNDIAHNRVDRYPCNGLLTESFYNAQDSAAISLASTFPRPHQHLTILSGDRIVRCGNPNSCDGKTPHPGLPTTLSPVQHDRDSSSNGKLCAFMERAVYFGGSVWGVYLDIGEADITIMGSPKVAIAHAQRTSTFTGGKKLSW